MNEEFNLPTETVDLPSEGLLYPTGHPLSSGKVEMKYMTAKEEDILTNANFIRNDTVLDKLLQSLCVTKFNYDDLLLTDKNALLIAARILGYGKDYTVNYYNPVSDSYEKVVVDLTQLKEKKLDPTKITPGVNEFNFTLPASGKPVTFKLLTHKDEVEIEKELEALKKAHPAGSYEITTRLKRLITSVEGNRDPAFIRKFSEAILATDARALRKHITTIQPEIVMEFNYTSETHVEEGVDIPITSDFFWPKL